MRTGLRVVLDPRRYHPSTIRAAWWCWRSLERARRDLPVHGVRTKVAVPPSVGRHAARGVLAVLRRTDPTCLERSLVEQAWLRAFGEDHDVLIGVAVADGERRMHAWIEGRRDGEEFTVLHRVPAR